MNKMIGLWIDHKRAVVMSMGEDGETMQTIESGIEHTRLKGAQRSRMPYSAQYPKGDDQLDKQFNGYLKKYYQKVLALLRGADSVLIFGPGEAKSELKKQILSRQSPPEVLGIETADKMTERQIAAKIRRHFKKPRA